MLNFMCKEIIKSSKKKEKQNDYKANPWHAGRIDVKEFKTHADEICVFNMLMTEDI